MLKPSPLKHTEGEGSEGHLVLSKEGHDEKHGGEATENLPELKDITVFNTDNPAPPKSIEQKKVEDKSTKAKLENNTSTSFFPNQIEPSIQDNANKTQPIHLADPKGENLKADFWGDTGPDDYKRKNNKWYLVKNGEEKEVGADPKTAGKKQTALLNNLNQSLWGGSKEINPNDPQTWIGKNNKTIAAGLRKSNTHPGIVVQDGSNNSAVIKLPNGKIFNINADDPEALKKYKEINDFYNTKPPVGKDKDLLTSLQFKDDKDFNKAWGSAGYSMTGYGEKQVLKGPDGKEIDLSDIQSELQEGLDGGQFGRASIFDAAKKYLHDNASAKDIAKIKEASIAESTKSIDAADVKRKALELDVDEEGKNSYVGSGSFKNEMMFSLTGQRNENVIKGKWDSNDPETWGDIPAGGIIEGTGVSQSTLDMVDAYYEKNIYNSYGEQKMLNEKSFTDLNPIIEKLKSIKEGEEGYAQAQADIKVMQNLLPQLDKTLKSGALKAENEIIDGALETYQAQQFRENKGQILASMGAEYMERESLTGTSEDPKNQSKMQLDLAHDHMMDNYKAEIEKFETVIQSTAEDAGKDGVSVSYDGINFMVDGEDAEKVAFYKKKFSGLNQSMIKDGEDFTQTKLDYTEKYKEWQNKHGQILDIENQSSREHNLFNMNMSKFGDGFRSMGYSALSLVDEQAAINKKQAMETGAIGLEKPLDYRTALKTGQKWRFATGELATQGANTIVAIASGGIGMAAGGAIGLGLKGAQTLASMTTGYGVFGTYSKQQKYMDLTIQQQAGEEAKKGLANLEKFKFMYEPDDYMRTKMQYEKAIAFGDITADQINAAAWTSFFVEGTITSFLGTVPNSINLIKKFSNPLQNMGTKLLRSDLKAFGAAAGQTGKGILGEIIEETSIEGLTTVGDGLILSREMDFSHLDDVAVTSIISSGPMTALPNTYAAITQQMQNAPYRKEVNGRLAKMKKLEEKFATLGENDGDYRSILTDQYKAEVEAIAGAHTGLEVDALALGADGVRKLLKGAVEENYLNQQASITSKDNVKSIEKKREAYKKSLSKEAAKDYQDRLDAVTDQKKTLTEGIDYDGATERIFGDKGIHLDNKLKNTAKYKKADKRGKLVMILDQVRKDKVDSNVQKAKNDPEIKAYVENHLYGEGGFEGSGRKNKKKKQEDAMYDDMANLLLVRQRNANITATEGNTNGKAILGDKRFGDLKIVDMNNDVEAFKAAVYDNDGFTVEEKQRIVDGLKSGKTKGAIIDNQYIALNGEAAQKNLDNGDLLQGTVVSHEISHFIDDASFENENEKAIYTHNLNGLISKNSPVVHDLALQRINKLKDVDGKPLYDESKTFEEQSIKYKDEYTKSVQDMFMDPAFENDFENVRKKSGVGIVNKARMALNKDFAADINSEKTAGAWMVGFIDNFKEGNLSPLARRKMDAKSDKTKEKGINTSQEASDKVQSIYEEQGVAGAFDIIDQFKPIVGRIVQKRSEAPNFDRQLLTDEIETGKRGIYDLIKEYKPESGVPLAAWINKYLPARAIEASKRVLGEEFMDDVSTKVDIAAEEVSQEPTQFKRKKIILSDRLNVKGKIDKAIKAVLPNLDVANLSFKTLKDQTPEITGEMFGISPKKLISGANITKKELQAAQMFISKNADVLIQMLPEGTTAGGTATGVPKTLLAPFYTKTDRAKMEKTGTKAGLAVQVKKPNISKAEFLEVFGIVDGVPNRTDRNTSARVLAIANQVGKMMTNQAVRQELVNQGKPLQSMGHLADGKSTVMFSDQGSQKSVQLLGNMDRSLSPEARVLFWDDISAFANENILDRNLESIKIGLRNIYGGVPEINKNIDKLAVAIHGAIKNVKDPIVKNPIKLVDKLLEINNRQLSKVKEYFNSDTTAADAFRDEQRVKNLVATTSVLSNRIFDPKNPGRSIAKILMMKGHLASSARNSHLDRKQPLPGNPEFLNATLGSIPGVEFKTNKSKDGKVALDKNSITYNGKPVSLETVTSAQSSQSALNDAKDVDKLNKRSEAEDVAQELLDDITDFYTELYNNGEIDNVDLQMVSASLLSNMDAVLARAAKLKYVSDDAYSFKNPGKEVKYEHMQPRVAVLLSIWDTKINGGGITDIKDFLKNYTIQVIPNTMDKVITESKLGESLYIGQTLAMPSWIRTYNDATKENDKGRLRPLVDVYTKKVLEPSAAFVKGIRILKPNYKANMNMSQAVENSRVPSEPRGITVLDFDDTLATTKSGVRAKIPNTDGEPKPRRKVIFLAGGAGSGKGNVIGKLGLENQGFKIVNSDISLEWLKKNNGLPADMNDLTAEQRSKLGSLQHQSRGIARRKMAKYQGNGDGVVVDGTGGSIKSMQDLVSQFEADGYDVSMMFVETSLPVALERNAARKERSLLDKIVTRNHESVQGNKDGFKTMFGNRFMEVNTDKLSQEDAMPTKLTDQMNDFVSGYENRRLDAEEFASEGADILDQGGTFDFSEFNKVVEGQTAPLFNKAMKLQDKFGNKDMFVLTARPAESAPAIFEFLKANGLNIPLENITGLANSTAEAKALWMADKVAEGYNDFYFADDALQNVKAVDNMLEQFDVKRKVQQARIKFSKSMNEGFNDILENITGIESEKRFSDIKARKRGDDKGKFRLFIPPSHEDFVGLLYNFMGKGKEGNAHRDFFEQALVRPLNRAYKEIDTAKQAVANDFKALNKEFKNVKDKLIKNTPDGDFTFQDAIRVYLWNKHGYKIPGLTTTDQQSLVELVNQDAELKAYAETLNVISKQDKYVDPGPNWETGNIRIDLVDATGRVGRKQYFAEFQENAETIFSEENLNKIEAAYGKDFKSALEDMLHRIKTGVNRPKGSSAKPNAFMNWLNASVAGVMFFNTRSALLQQMSNVNYLNFADNNIYAAGKAFANQPQYWKDFAMIFNSDMMKQRRGGLGTDINGAELAEAIKKARPDNIFDQVAIITGKALKLGFLPTQIGDNIAIATGGAAFYRNRVNKYVKDGLSQKEAEAAAFTDFQNITQSTQQSARPDMTSQQQASWIGKLVLNFLNTPSQYNRIIKKAGSDIKNRRMTPPNTSQTKSDMSNMSRILYYGAAQNLIFYSLQTALFAVMFGGDDEDDDKRAEQFLKKKERVINGSIDTILRGSGIYGVAISTLKNMTIKFMEQREKGYNKDESAVLMEGLNFSPVLGIKARRIVNAEKTLNYNKKVIAEMETLDIDNPVWSAVTNIIQATTGAPLNKMYQKTINLRNAMDAKYTAFQRALFLSGYTTWSLNLGDTEKMKGIKEDVKEKTKIKSKEKAKVRKEEKKKEVAKENEAVIEENKKKSKKDGICSAISKGGQRCKSKAINGGMCTVHEKAEQNIMGVKSQCKKIKDGGKRCGMQTASKSGFCYYHD